MDGLLGEIGIKILDPAMAETPVLIVWAV